MLKACSATMPRRLHQDSLRLAYDVAALQCAAEVRDFELGLVQRSGVGQRGGGVSREQEGDVAIGLVQPVGLEGVAVQRAQAWGPPSGNNPVDSTLRAPAAAAEGPNVGHSRPAPRSVLIASAMPGVWVASRHGPSPESYWI
jgi:hypothetical protein